MIVEVVVLGVGFVFSEEEVRCFLVGVVVWWWGVVEGGGGGGCLSTSGLNSSPSSPATSRCVLWCWGKPNMIQMSGILHREEEKKDRNNNNSETKKRLGS